MFPKKLKAKLEQRHSKNALRSLGASNQLIDFSSNDYLGFSSSKKIFNTASKILKKNSLEFNGATGSRLLTGNHFIYSETERVIAAFHNCEEALIFNSGYDANIGFFSGVPQRGDIILYDELCHASIRDGIKMSNAKAFKFKHNNLEDIERKLSTRSKSRTVNQECYLVTESIFSMDGDQPDLKVIVKICKKYKCNLVVDEAHAVGVFGNTGEGLVQELGIEKDVFARIVTFGKALGCHGAAILGTRDLKEYLINFARSFIYTTGLPPHSVATILASYYELQYNRNEQNKLNSNIAILRKFILDEGIEDYFIYSESAIHCCLIAGNDNVKDISAILQLEGFDVKPILSPTVPNGQERLRICVHNCNTEVQIKKLINTIKKSI